MSPELDIRDARRNRATAQRALELQSLALTISDRLPGKHRITIERLDPSTGNAASIVSEGAPRTTDGNFIKRALEHVRAISPAMGVVPQSAEFIADSALQVSSGARAINLQQRYKGIPVFQAVTTVRFAADGTIQDTTGRSVAVRKDVNATPRLSAKDAVRTAAAFLAGVGPDAGPGEPSHGPAIAAPGAPTVADLVHFEPAIRVAFSSVADRPTVLEPGPFGAEIKAGLVWFPHNDQLMLGWSVLLTLRRAGQYLTIVDATSGSMLYCHEQASSSASEAA
jgi:hypothetical protein